MNHTKLYFSVVVKSNHIFNLKFKFKLKKMDGRSEFAICILTNVSYFEVEFVIIALKLTKRISKKNLILICSGAR